MEYLVAGRQASNLHYCQLCLITKNLTAYTHKIKTEVPDHSFMLKFISFSKSDMSGKRIQQKIHCHFGVSFFSERYISKLMMDFCF